MWLSCYPLMLMLMNTIRDSRFPRCVLLALSWNSTGSGDGIKRGEKCLSSYFSMLLMKCAPKINKKKTKNDKMPQLNIYPKNYLKAPKFKKWPKKCLPQYSPVQLSRAQHSPIQLITTQYSQIQLGTAQYSPVHLSTAQLRQYSPVRLSSAQHSPL